MIFTVNAANLSQPQIVDQYASKSKHFRTGMRFALEALGIDLPAPLQRKPGGRPRGSANPSRMTLWREQKRAQTCPGHSPA
jgi:hypothetical protein